VESSFDYILDPSNWLIRGWLGHFTGKFVNHPRQIAAISSAILSLFSIWILAIIWALSNVRGFQTDAPRMLVYAKKDSPNPLNEDPWIMIGGTQRFAFFITHPAYNVEIVAWDDIKRTEINCGNIGKFVTCPQSWSRPDFDCRWPFAGGIAGSPTAN
jgi:hypothetical protein